MSQFVVSARKYRPDTFNSVVGQSAITSTLKNAMNNNHLAQAFLFCGPRGVGKTTCARILAKTINCENLTKETEPCNKCESCTSFNNGQSLNIHELDAASNNSVDDIRNLTDQVRFAPQMGSHKVYIIDEVHMLSQAAFNAFLKTLEEPPPHAIFILATTEKHKIIPTILSRCQIFDFKRIQIADISKHLAYISKEEKIESEEEGLHIIAQKADGALRDALSIFDQIVSFSGNKITYDDVITNLNILDYDYYFRVSEAILGGDIPNSLLIFDEILNKGFNGHNFINGLAEHFRNLLVCKDPGTIGLLEVGDKIAAKYTEQSGKFSQQELLLAINACNKCDLNYKISKNQRLLVELTLMQLCSVKTTLEKKSLDITDFDISLDFSGGKSVGFVSKQVSKQVSAKPSSPPPATPVEKVKKEVEVATKAKVGLNKNMFSGFGISLNSKKEEQKEESIEEFEQRNTAKDPFTETQLYNTWHAYAKKVRKENKESLYITLIKHDPKIGDNYTVELKVENRVQFDDLKLESAELQGYLRKKLNNYSIQLVPVLIKAEETKMIYTSKDKFERMSEKNPLLLELKKRLFLDIEH